MSARRLGGAIAPCCCFAADGVPLHVHVDVARDVDLMCVRARVGLRLRLDLS